MSNSKMQIAQALAQYPVMSEPGLEQPPEMKALQALSQVGQGYGMGQMGGAITQALIQKGLPALQGLGNAGALFPEGISISQVPKVPGAMKEFGQVLTPAEKAYRLAEDNLDFHSSNYDWPRVLQDKWALLKNSGGN